MTLNTVLVFIIGCLVDGISGTYTCSYYDNWGRLHQLYCSSNLCCGSIHSKYCCEVANVGSIVGGVIGFIIFVSIVSTICCCFCACCPGYRYRESRTVIVTSPGTNYASTATSAPYNSPAPGPYTSPAPGPYTSPAPGPYTAKPAGAYTEPPPSYQV